PGFNDGWSLGPIRASPNGGVDAWRIGGTIAGNVVLYMDDSATNAPDEFDTYDDLYPQWRGPISWGAAAGSSYGVADVVVDPRGTMSMVATNGTGGALN